MLTQGLIGSGEAENSTVHAQRGAVRVLRTYPPPYNSYHQHQDALAGQKLLTLNSKSYIGQKTMMSVLLCRQCLRSPAVRIRGRCHQWKASEDSFEG